MTLIELLVATSVAGILFTGMVSLTFFAARSFAALTNYVELDTKSRLALDKMTREIRQADSLLSGDEHELIFLHTDPANGNNYTISYVYNPDARTLTRIKNGVQTVLLTECDELSFSIFQRNPIGGTYDQYPTASADTCKVVQMSWTCSRRIRTEKVNTESVQSAKVVIRKQ